MYIKRQIEEAVLRMGQSYPVIMVCGQNKVGKSTMLNHIKEPGRRYVSLDDRNARRLAETDPALFLQTYGCPLLIDEFQKAPGLLETIKDMVDKKGYAGEPNAGLFWLSGSQKFRMMKDVSESLAGRVAILEMSSFSQSELEGRGGLPFFPEIADLQTRPFTPKNTEEIYRRIFEGGMPKLISDPAMDRDRYYSDYVNTYLERDIRDLAQVGKINQFYDFLVYVASRTAQEIKYDDIAKAVGVSAPTAKSWISILEQSGVIYILRPYASRLTNRLVKTPKLYFMDTGLAAYLCRWPNAETLQNGNMDGAFLETYVVSEIVKSYWNAGKPLNDLYYYRDIDQKEIGLLFAQADALYPIEVKKAIAPTHPDKNFSALNKFGLTVKPGVVCCMVNEMTPINKNCYLFPVCGI